MGVTTAPMGSRQKRRRTAADDDAKRKADARREGLYHCDYCHRDLSTSLRIKCAVCPDFDLCLDCYAVGAEIAQHSSDHAYRVVDNLSFPVFTLDWGADEEMLLLEAVELHGLGNWTRVGEHVGKPPEDCKSHYFAVYVETDTFPHPKHAPEMVGIDIRALIEERRRAGQERIALAKQAAARGPDEPEFGPQSRQSRRAEEIKAEVRLESTGPFASDYGGAGKGSAPSATPSVALAPAADLATPANDAAVGPTGGEKGAVAGKTMAGGPNAAAVGVAADPAAPVMLSEAQQTGYHVKRNEFDPEYDHEAETIIAELEFNEGDSEDVTARKLRLIDIYNRRLDERERRRAFVLSRGLVNVKRQQAVDRRRAPAEREFVGRLRVLAKYLPQQQWEALSDGLAAEGRLRSRITELQRYRAMGMRTFDEVERWEAVESRKRKEVPPASQPGKSRLQRIPVDETALEAELAALGQSHAVESCHAQHSQIADGKGPSGMDAWRARRGVLLDVASLPDIGPLTSSERHLCASERFLPAQYLSIKAETMALQATKGKVSRADVEGLPFLIGKERAARLHSFFVELGWVTPPLDKAEGRRVTS